jgi:hypothetical protein
VIRKAVSADIPRLVEMGEKFIRETGHPFDRQIATETMTALVEGDTSVVLVNDDCTAMLGGLLYRNFFNSETVAQELFWWAKSGGRELLEGFESWAAENGAGESVMMCLETHAPDRVSAIYRRRGYEPRERTFARKL